MKRDLTGLLQTYVTGLKKHLASGPEASLLPAMALGRRAVALGIETLALARIHEQACLTLDLAKVKGGSRKRADHFFDEVLVPIVATHRAARQCENDLNNANETLDRRTAELAETNGEVRRGAVRQRKMETALKKGGGDYDRLLKESLKLPASLQHLTHLVLLTQERERLGISTQLRDEIAQNLLGINVHLLGLKTAPRYSRAEVREKISGIQKLVKDSIRLINRFARELGTHQTM